MSEINGSNIFGRPVDQSQAFPGESRIFGRPQTGAPQAMDPQSFMAFAQQMLRALARLFGGWSGFCNCGHPPRPPGPQPMYGVYPGPPQPGPGPIQPMYGVYPGPPQPGPGPVQPMYGVYPGPINPGPGPVAMYGVYVPPGGGGGGGVRPMYGVYF